MTLGYVGTMGHHLFSLIEYNSGNAARCLQIRQLFVAAGQGGSACGPFGEDVIYNLNGQTFYGTRPYSVTDGKYLSRGLLDFSDNTYSATFANSNYHSLQVTVNKNVGAWRFLAAYSWSKAIDDSSGFTEIVNPYNNRLSRSLAGFDVPHNFVVSYSYDLPFARMHSSRSGALSKLVDGWQVSGITRFAKGLPVTLAESGDLSL